MQRSAHDPVWSLLTARFYGLRSIQDASLFESMVKVIIGQQLTVQFVAALLERLLELGAKPLKWMVFGVWRTME